MSKLPVFKKEDVEGIVNYWRQMKALPGYSSSYAVAQLEDKCSRDGKPLNVEAFHHEDIHGYRSEVVMYPKGTMFYVNCSGCGFRYSTWEIGLDLLNIADKKEASDE